MAAPRCKVCEAKSETIRALELAVQTLTEMVNLQRALPVGPPSAYPSIPAPAGDPESAEPDVEDIADRLNNDPDLDPEVAERLLTQLQVVGGTEA